MRALGSLILVFFATSLTIAQSRTSIMVEIRADGACSIAVRGAKGGHSEMSYVPSTPGRCAIPATRDTGPVHLEVRLAEGSRVPDETVPALSWTRQGARLLGSADLPSAPEFVDIMPARSAEVSFATRVVLIVLGAAAVTWAVAYGWIQRRRA